MGDNYYETEKRTASKNCYMQILKECKLHMQQTALQTVSSIESKKNVQSLQNFHGQTEDKAVHFVPAENCCQCYGESGL